MLLILPLAAFVFLWGAMAAHGAGSAGINMDRVRPGFVAAAAFWGAFLTLLTEALSLGHLVTAPWIAGAWGAGALAAGLLAWRAGALQRVSRAAKGRPIGVLGWWGTFAWAMAGVLAGSLLVVALIAPPNNTDSLLYHLSRVAHWQQNASLAHYPAAYNNQLWTQIWAETAILHLNVLAGSDRTANLVQWFAMVGSLIAASAIAKLLGARKQGQWLATAFAFSLPIGILESTSTQNDYVAAFWLISFTYFVLLSRKRDLSRLEWLSMAMCLGLGVLTKATIYLVGFPIAVWLFGSDLLRGQVKATIFSGFGVAATIVILNLGYWVRDMITFGGPFGSSNWTASRVPLEGSATHLVAPLQQILLNFATPSEALTRLIVFGEKSLESRLGISNSPFVLTWAWNNEDLAGNPLHVALIILALAGLFSLWRKRARFPQARPVTVFALVGVVSFLTFSTLALFAEHGVRYQIPLFLLFAPVVGYVGDRLLSSRVMILASLALAIWSLPWILFNQSRPMIGWRPRTRVDSIFTVSRERLLFANWPELQDPYSSAAKLVHESSCQNVGLVIDSHDKEYLLWYVLGAPENGMRLEVLDPLSASSRYLDPSFEPCAVVCTICGADRTEWGGLPLAGDFDAARVFLK